MFNQLNIIVFDKKSNVRKERMREDLLVHAQKVQAEYDRQKKRRLRFIDPDYVKRQMVILQEQAEKFQAKQEKALSRKLGKIKYTELQSFKCHDCASAVDMVNLTCPTCGALYCQWCGAAMDMMNPALCPRCKNPPFYTPAAMVVMKVEDMAPEDRFWEESPSCPQCSATVQFDWPECPICNAKLKGNLKAPAKPMSCTFCDATVQSDWDECPICQTKIKK
jgi:hypothetical protein